MKFLRDKIIHFLMVTNCLYLLSAALLLLGAYLLMHSPILSKDPLTKYIEVYAILQIYEVLLIVICLLVLRKLSVVEDGLILTGIEIVLFLDPTFFNNAFYAFNLPIGLTVNLFCLLFMLVKYAVLLKIGKLPYSHRINLCLFITAIFVYLYPAILSRSFERIDVDYFYYFLCWVPLILAVIVPRIDLMVKKMTNKLSITANQKRNLFSAIVLISSWIVFSHLIESLIGYGLTFRAIYISPFLIAFCFLLIKLKPEWVNTANGKQFLWIAPILAILTSMFTGDKFLYPTILGFYLSPLRFVLVANIYFSIYIWKKYNKRSYYIASFIYGTLFFSGHTIGNIIENMGNYPLLLFLAIIFSVLAILKKRWNYTAIASLFYLFMFLSIFHKVDRSLSLFVFWQAAGFWLIFVFWKANITNKYFLQISVVILLILHAFLKSIGYEYSIFYNIYFWVLICGLFLFGFLRKFIFLKTIVVIGFLVKLIYDGRQAFSSSLSILQRHLRSGVVIVILAFVILLFGYYISSLKRKVRKLGHKKRRESKIVKTNKKL